MIYLYSKTLPNYDNNAHYIASSPADFWLSLGDDYIPITEDKFMLNGNELTVSLPDDALTDDITYIAWNNAGNWRFYFVNTQMTQSGYSVYSLSLDLWATYINQAELSNMRLTRCNRNVIIYPTPGIRQGIYDSIPACNYTSYEVLEETPTTEDLAIVFTAVVSTGRASLFANTETSYTATFGKKISELGDGTIDSAIRWVSGIYGAIINNTLTEYNACVLKAYILPYDVLKFKPQLHFTDVTGEYEWDAPQFRTVVYGDEGTSSSEVKTFVPREIAPSQSAKLFDIEIDPNYKYYVGTKLAGLEIDRVTTSTQITIRFVTKQDGANVYVVQGDKMKDITNSFGVNLTTNDGNVVGLERIGQVLQTASGIASGVFQMYSGGAGYVTGALSITNALANTVKNTNGHYIAGGDALNTYRDPDNGNPLPAFYCVKHRSMTDEKEHARLFGATFNQQLTDLSDILDYDLLGSGSLADTYVEMSLRVDKVPIEARDIIKATFENGVYLRFV